MSTFFLFLLLFISTPPPSSAQQTLSSFSISNSPWTPRDNLTSPNSAFAAGFLPLPSSPNLFNFSIWFHNISAANSVVWSTTYPLAPSAALSITSTGLLLLSNSSSSSNQNLWPTPPSGETNTTQLKLRNDGNLIYGGWESFTFPTDTALPNQTLTGNNFTLVSKNRKFRFINSTQLVFNVTEPYQDLTNAFQSFDSAGKMTQANGASFIVSDFGPKRSRRLTLDNDGNLRIYSFDPSLHSWTVVWQSGYELCQVHGTCGPNAICVSDGATSDYYCVCPPGRIGRQLTSVNASQDV
ncbi:hypothetical protein ACLB2K_033704 [Fragaria x ananassa]